jgi:hypothetical protein
MLSMANSKRPGRKIEPRVGSQRVPSVSAASASRVAAPEPGDLPPFRPPRKPWLPALGRSLRDTLNILAALYLLGVICAALYYLGPSVTRTWFYRSDEYVVVAEIIRFAGLDFHQHFFDMPGTPFMILVALLWTPFSVFGSIVSPASAPGVSGFTFHHLDWLFYLTRGVTLFFYALSIALCFQLAQRVLNKPAACVAALLVAMSPTYAAYSSLVRVESMAMCLILGATLVASHGLENAPEVTARRPYYSDAFVVAGVMAGIGAAARLHSVMASVPLLWMIIVLRPRPAAVVYPRWIRRLARYAVPILSVCGAVGIQISRMITAYPHAGALLQKPVILLAVGPLLVVALYRTVSLRRYLLLLAPPETIKLAMGLGVGLVLGLPTIVTQGQFFLGSMEMYSATYRDFYRVPWPYLKDLRWLMEFYLHAAAPTRTLTYLLLIGVLLVLVTRSRILLPYLLIAIFFFFSKPIDLVASPHHLILWLPFFAILSAFPVALASSWIGRLFGSPRLVAALTIPLTVLLCFGLVNGPNGVTANMRNDEIQLRNVSTAASWLARNSRAGDDIGNAYFCFDPGTFFTWLRSLEVSVPPAFIDGRQHFIWWGRQSELAGKAGYVSVSPADVDSVKRSINPANAADVADPYNDGRYQLAASFGTDPHRVDVFRFDFAFRAPR